MTKVSVGIRHSLWGLLSSVIGEVQLGELLCDSLVEAEDAPLLQFAISANEVSAQEASDS